MLLATGSPFVLFTAIVLDTKSRKGQSAPQQKNRRREITTLYKTNNNTGGEWLLFVHSGPVSYIMAYILHTYYSSKHSVLSIDGQ